MVSLKFYNVKGKKSFTTDKFDIRTKKVKGKNRKFAVAAVPGESFKAWRVLPKDFKK